MVYVTTVKAVRATLSALIGVAGSLDAVAARSDDPRDDLEPCDGQAGPDERCCARLCVLACGGPAPGSPLASGNKPIVALQAPANGVQVAVGSAVAVSGTASDSVGVNSVVLFADNVSVANLPAGQPTQSLPFNLTWTAAVPGSHALQVFAYRADGTPSDPAVVQ